jgi:hypothetical protein
MLKTKFPNVVLLSETSILAKQTKGLPVQIPTAVDRFERFLVLRLDTYDFFLDCPYLMVECKAFIKSQLASRSEL